MNRNALLDQLRNDALRDQAKAERASPVGMRITTPSTAIDPLQLVADLKSRINPAYANQIGTESYERGLCAEAIEGLMQERDELLAALERVVADPYFTELDAESQYEADQAIANVKGKS